MKRAYFFPPLLSREAKAIAEPYLTDRCRPMIREAWREGKAQHDGASIKGARDAVRCYQPTPADLQAMVGWLVAFREASLAQEDLPLEWMRYSSLPADTPKRGTTSAARYFAQHAIMAAVSILLEVPIEHESDERALLQTLALANWQMPSWQKDRVTKRMTRYVTNCIQGRPFVPAIGGAT